MNRKVIFKHPLLVQKPVSNLSCPQKCKIPQNIDFPAAGLMKVKSDNRTFLCRLYYLSELHDDKRSAYIDDSVEILETPSHSMDEIKWIQEVEVIAEPHVEFRALEIHLHLNVNKLNMNVIKQTRDLMKLTVSVMKHYKFSVDCEISCNRNGISKISVLKTDAAGYGTIADDGIIKIAKIFIDLQSSLGRNELGGMEAAKASLTNLIKTNIEFMRNPELFTLKPPCQALISGPVGVGKTSLVHHAANKLDCIMLEISADVFQPLPGATEEKIEEILNQIKSLSRLIGSNQLIIVLLENMEIFCPKFNSKMKENSHSGRVSSLILSILDEIACMSSMVVIGTTSKLESLNIAVRRSNRMGSCEVIIDMPNEQQRLSIIGMLCKQISTGFVSERLQTFIAQSTPGFVGADLEVLCQFVSRHLLNGNLEINEVNLQQTFEIGLKSIRPSVMRDNLGIVTRSTMKFDAIGGMKDLKRSLLTSVLGPLRHPEKFRQLGLRSPSGILLYGPSGCAKTTIIKCLAGETKMTLISVSSAEIYSPYVGEAETFLVKVFNQARMNAPTILFFDEIDIIVGNRSVSGGGGDAHTRILSTLLTEIDGFAGSDKKTVLIMGATNKPNMIDDALMRPGRFDKLIHVPAPSCEARVGILKFIARAMPIADDVDIESLAEKTINYSGADLVNLCSEAAMCAATRDLCSKVIERSDFEDVLTYLGPSLTENQIEFYEKFESLHRKTT